MLNGPSFIPTKINKAVILCHGYGASGDDLADLIPNLAPDLPETAFFARTPLIYYRSTVTNGFH